MCSKGFTLVRFPDPLGNSRLTNRASGVLKGYGSCLGRVDKNDNYNIDKNRHIFVKVDKDSPARYTEGNVEQDTHGDHLGVKPIFSEVLACRVKARIPNVQSIES